MPTKITDNGSLLDRECAMLDGTCDCIREEGQSFPRCFKYGSLQDLGCNWPDCDCLVPDYAFSNDKRKQYCEVYVKELIRKKLIERYKNSNP